MILICENSLADKRAKTLKSEIKILSKIKKEMESDGKSVPRLKALINLKTKELKGI